MHKILKILLLNVIYVSAAYATQDNLLSPDEAFSINAQMRDADTVVVTGISAKGYALYRDKFQFESLTDGVRLGEPVFPEGTKHDDEWFGQVEVYKKSVSIDIPVVRENRNNTDLVLKIVNQGYAEQGFLYPPMIRTIQVFPYKSYTPPKYLKTENSSSKFYFKRVSSLEELHKEISSAKKQKKFVMLDFYAGWCTYCYIYENEIYGDKEIQELLSEFILLQVDVTVFDSNVKELADYNNVVAPPAIVFWNREGEKLTEFRAVGPVSTEKFKILINSILAKR